MIFILIRLLDVPLSFFLLIINVTILDHEEHLLQTLQRAVGDVVKLSLKQKCSCCLSVVTLQQLQFVVTELYE